MLIVATTRPELFERAPTWAANARNANRINLSPLADDETGRLVSNLLGSPLLADDVRATIVERAGGNPLFAEELVRLLTERGAITKTIGWSVEPGAAIDIPPAVESVIAARLDTLPPDRRRLLQDASVVGEVFWSGAVADMNELPIAQVVEALHELARKDLIRPIRKSSMAGEGEYAFFHALVREVCYGQIPRAKRSERHRRAAEWMESVSGERVEDHAEILTSHYLTALEFAPPDADRTALSDKALQYLIASGDRALGLDTAKAEASYAKALELALPGHPQRPAVLARWGEAAQQRGRLTEAISALREAVSLFREQGEEVATARALTTLANFVWAGGSAESVAMAAEAVALLDGRPGPELLAAYSEMARQLTLTGDDVAGAIEVADRAFALAAELKIGEPVKALGYRGAARVGLGERAGLDDMRRALALAVERGEGWEAGILYNNIAMDVREIEGPSAALAVWEEGVEFSERRGIETLGMASAICGIRFSLGLWDGLLDLASDAAERLEAHGQALRASNARAVEARVLALQGRASEALRAAQAAAEVVRHSRARSYVTPAYGAAALSYVMAGHPETARSLVSELLDFTGIDLLAEWLADLVRTSVRSGATALAEQLTSRVKPLHPLREHALCASRAIVAEAHGELSTAGDVYAEAATRWEQFRMLPERAFALLGQGRCLVALGRHTEAIGPLEKAREIFQWLGAVPALEETEHVLRKARPANAEVGSVHSVDSPT